MHTEYRIMNGNFVVDDCFDRVEDALAYLNSIVEEYPKNALTIQGNSWIDIPLTFVPAILAHYEI